MVQQTGCRYVNSTLNVMKNIYYSCNTTYPFLQDSRRLSPCFVLELLCTKLLVSVWLVDSVWPFLIGWFSMAMFDWLIQYDHVWLVDSVWPCLIGWFSMAMFDSVWPCLIGQLSRANSKLYNKVTWVLSWPAKQTKSDSDLFSVK